MPPVAISRSPSHGGGKIEKSSSPRATGLFPTARRIAIDNLPALLVIAGLSYCGLSIWLAGNVLLQPLFPESGVEGVDRLFRETRSVALVYAPACVLWRIPLWRAGRLMKAGHDVAGRKLGRIACWIALIGGLPFTYGTSRALSLSLPLVPMPEDFSRMFAVWTVGATAAFSLGYPVLLLYFLHSHR